MDKFYGKVVLPNFWASWRAPCVEEMPSLEALSASLPPDRFVVAAVSLDGGDGQQVRWFINRNNLPRLTVVLDPAHKFGALTSERKPEPVMPVCGYPTTYVLDKRGLVIGFLVGPTTWDSPHDDFRRTWRKRRLRRCRAGEFNLAESRFVLW